MEELAGKGIAKSILDLERPGVSGGFVGQQVASSEKLQGSVEVQALWQVL